MGRNFGLRSVGDQARGTDGTKYQVAKGVKVGLPYSQS